jgi:very-short-patch-repair endonuclease
MTDTEPDPWTTIQELASTQSDVVSRRQLYGAGLTRWQVAAQLKAQRWQRLGDQAVCLHNGPVTDAQHQWAAVFQGGPRAKLDGAAALVAGGLERYTVDRLRVSVPRGAQARRTPTYDVRQTRRWDEADRMPTGVPRARPAPAAVRGALWAVSDRQATYLLTVTVQQGMATAEAVAVEALTVKRHKRRLLVQAVVSELLDGARSLGEIDVARELRARGLPSPTRQAVRKDNRGRYYLDLYWPEWRLVLEIDGIHHAWAENVVSDALRQNSLAIAGDTVLRLPLLGLRLRPDDFFEQIEEALRANGWAQAA